MQSRQFVVANPHGLHLRVAGRIAQIVRQHDARVTVSNAARLEADARSVLSLIALGAAHGSALTIVAEGPGEAQVTTALSEVFNDGSGI